MELRVGQRYIRTELGNLFMDEFRRVEGQVVKIVELADYTVRFTPPLGTSDVFSRRYFLQVFTPHNPIELGGE